MFGALSIIYGLSLRVAEKFFSVYNHGMVLALYVLAMGNTIHYTAFTSLFVPHTFLFLILPHLHRDAGFCQVFRCERLRKRARDPGR